MRIGDAVRFSFTLYGSFQHAMTMTGEGVIVDREFVGFHDGYLVRVTASPDYKPGEIVTVGDTNVRALKVTP